MLFSRCLLVTGLETMNIVQLKAFEALARTRNFSRAAQTLGVSQPAITSQIKSFQDDYGIALLRRRGHAMDLSPIGRELLPRVKHAVRLVNEIERLMSNPDDLDLGQLSIGLNGPLSAMEALSFFTRRYPKVRISAQMANSSKLLELLAECRIDVAILNALEPPPDLFSLRSKIQRLSVVVPSSHFWAGRDSVDITELDSQPIVLREHGSAARDHFDQMTASAGIAPHIVLELNSHEGMKQAVARGLGIAIVHEIQLGMNDKLVELPVTGSNIRAAQYIVCQPEFRQLRIVDAFLTAARKDDGLSSPQSMHGSKN